MEFFRKYTVDRNYKRIAIIGGGDMGVPLGQMLMRLGHEVKITRPLDPACVDNAEYMRCIRQRNTKLAQDAQAVIFGLGMDQMCMEDTRHIFSRPDVLKDKLAMDMNSTKRGPKRMLRTLENVRLGLTHPLCRLRTEAPLDQRNMVICPDETTSEADYAFMENLWGALGPRVHYMDADQHDRAMCIIQAESHLSFLLPQYIHGNSTLDAQVIPNHGKPQVDHWLENILSNTPNVIAGIAELNEYRMESLRVIISKIRERIMRDLGNVNEMKNFFDEQIITCADDINKISLYLPDIALPHFGLSWDSIRHLHTDISAARVRLVRTMNDEVPNDFLDARFDDIPPIAFEIVHAHLLQVERAINSRCFIDVINTVCNHRPDIIHSIKSKRVAA